MQTIERINVDRYNDAMTIARRDLLAEAATKLNYKPAHPQSLIYQLLAIGVVPFRTSDVLEYKASKENNGMWSGTRNLIIHLCTVLACVPIAIIGSMHYMRAEFTTMGLVAFIFDIATGVNAVCMACHSPGHGRRWHRSWKEDSLYNLERIIPDHVLSLALSVKRAIPEATFTVEHLVTTIDHNPRPDPDPFLKVYLHKEWYYIEQWDEKDLPKLDE